MNEIFLSLGLHAWKPYLIALFLPPLLPLLPLAGGAWLATHRRPLSGWALMMAGACALWLMATPVVGFSLVGWLLQPPPALTAQAVTGLNRAPRTAVVVLGVGRPDFAPEYGTRTLRPAGIERLRYALWLSRETSLPVGYSGGLSRGMAPEANEAYVAGQVAQREFGRPLDWVETSARDLRENAAKTVGLLAAKGVEQVVLVTHDYHMGRALRNFERAKEGRPLKIIAAPMGLHSGAAFTLHGWIPSPQGFELTWFALHEWLGLLGGA